MAIFNSVLELIGNTPILKLCRYSKENSAMASIFAKLEYFNPAGSAKDRVARQMIEDAEKSGALKKGATIIESTSGNTGIGLCAAAIPMGYKVIITMPETMSEERRKLMKIYGAELVLTDGKKGMQGAVDKAIELNAQIEGSFLASQFTNPSNYIAHQNTTGPEIYKDLDGKVDIFVAGVGTGGTVTGVGKYLKSKNPDVKIIAVEPESSAVLSGKEKGAHGIQGIGAGFIPEILDLNVIDEIIAVSDEDAFKQAKNLAKTEGVLCGISSGAALFGALEVAKKEENSGKNVVVLLTDTGERYLSTQLFD